MASSRPKVNTAHLMLPLPLNSWAHIFMDFLACINNDANFFDFSINKTLSSINLQSCSFSAILLQMISAHSVPL